MCGTAPGGRLEPLHAVSMLGVPQPCRQALWRQVHPEQVRDGHGHGALPSDGAEEGQEERAVAVAGQGGVPEAAS